jgi:plasmid stabilization system protein ParE
LIPPFNPIVEHKVVMEKVRRVLVIRFPYAVYYYRDEKKATVKILAVLHNKQSIERLLDRI